MSSRGRIRVPHRDLGRPHWSEGRALTIEQPLVIGASSQLIGHSPHVLEVLSCLIGASRLLQTRNTRIVKDVSTTTVIRQGQVMCVYCEATWVCGADI